MTGEDLCSWIWIVDVPDISMDQGWLITPHTLEDRPAFNSKSQLLIETQFHWLNPFPQASNMAFKDPTFADWALNQFWMSADEVIIHLPKPPHPFPTSLLRGGGSGKGSWAFSLFDPFLALGKGGKGWERVKMSVVPGKGGKGSSRFSKFLRVGVGKGSEFTLNFCKCLGKGWERVK